MRPKAAFRCWNAGFMFDIVYVNVIEINMLKLNYFSSEASLPKALQISFVAFLGRGGGVKSIFFFFCSCCSSRIRTLVALAI